MKFLLVVYYELIIETQNEGQIKILRLIDGN